MKYCPKYLITDSSITIEENDIEENKKVTKVMNKYEKMECNEKCALYDFRPKCIIS